MRRNGLPRFVVVLMVIAALVFLGPPALGVLAGLLGLAVGLAFIAVKVGVIALGIYAAVLLLQALFGSSPAPRRLSASMPPVPYEPMPEVDHEKAALDRELAKMLAQQGKSL
ncbi:MAG: hypothetical protein U0228_32995 [Myxococcaceae bacterium]